MPVAEVDQREIEGSEPPVGHHLHQPSLAHEVGLDHRRQLSDAAAREQRRRQTGVVVHRKGRLEGQRVPVLSVLVDEGPAAVRLPMREREETKSK